LWELTSLFELLPEIYPQQRRPQQHSGTLKGDSEQNRPCPDTRATNTQQATFLAVPSTLANYLRRLLPWIFTQRAVDPSNSANITGKPNPFAALKMGKKIVIIAAVDMGNISFFRFGQGEFREWPMIA